MSTAHFIHRQDFMGKSMTVTNADTRTTQELRAELKAWEKSFAQAHDDRKPTRDDIRSDATIAEKYKRFNRLTRPEPATRPVLSTPRKRASDETQWRQPLIEKTINIDTRQTAQTREKVLQPEQDEADPTPAHVRCALGPTPQKDGLVLGIFDLYSATPSKPAMNELEQAVSATPSKVLLMPTTTTQQSRTPQSSGKRFYLDAFAGTPLKRKREDDADTPASVKKQFATPSFLRRDSRFEPIIEEDSTFVSKRPGTRKGLARSFSSILANLRKNEDERMDEEWDILQELEAEENTGEVQPRRISNATAVVVADSQGVEMPLGPDEAAGSDKLEAEKKSGLTRKPWKKKGLKRQTKKTNMKPVLHAPQKAVVAETQLADDDQAEDASKSNEIETGKTEGPIRKAVRKVNEAAHMNFRRLKIKSKNTKPKGRFGRR